MYKPKFNSVLVEIDDKDAQWGGGNDEAMLGKSYSKGKILSVASFVPTDKYPITGEGLAAAEELTKRLKGKDILWNEGAEAGTLFDDNGKLYGFIYWWDIRGVKDEPSAA